jgi:DNA-binding winged helix-turn-helix (wHTH) protein/TolB-like protein
LLKKSKRFPNAVMSLEIKTLYEFGEFRLSVDQHRLLRQNRAVPLTPKAFELLVVLIQSGGRLLTKDDLMKKVWPDSFVEEANLTVHISSLRKALGNSPDGHPLIETVPKLGYRFVVPVREVADASPATPCPSPPPNLTPAESFSSPVPLLARPRPWSHSYVRIAVILLALAGATGLFFRFGNRPTKVQVLSAAGPRRLAILPFQNLRPDPDTDFLGYSLADAVITKLGYLSALSVRPSATIQKYRNQMIDVPKVAAELNVDTLLTGNFIREGDDLRITYQLLDAKSERIIGRGAIDLKYDKLLKVQDSVAKEIIGALELNLSPSEAERILTDAPVNPVAYEYYLRGVDLYGKHDFPHAIQMLEKSIEIDSNYALTWAYLGASYTSDAAFELGGREQYRKAQAAYERALRIQPTQLEAHLFLANLLIDNGRVEQAVPLLRDALHTNPNRADLHWELGYAYRFAGMLQESVAECELALRLDPLVKANGAALNTYLYLGEYDKFLRSLPNENENDNNSAFLVFYRGFGEYHLKQWQRAARDFDRAYGLDPSLYTQIGKALSNQIAHREAEGLAMLAALEKKIADRGVGDAEATYKMAQAYAVLGDTSSALRLLRLSIQNGFFAHPYFAPDPLLESLRRDPEFESLMQTAETRHKAFQKAFF